MNPLRLMRALAARLAARLQHQRLRRAMEKRRLERACLAAGTSRATARRVAVAFFGGKDDK